MGSSDLSPSIVLVSKNVSDSMSVGFISLSLGENKRAALNKSSYHAQIFSQK